MWDQDVCETLKKAILAGGDVVAGGLARNLSVEKKDVASPLVTEVDREAERAIRDVIRSKYPDHLIQGEEFQDERPPSSEKNTISWIIDPLDGTTAYLAGIPTYTVLVGVWQNKQPIIGAIYQPLLKELWIGGKSYKTTLNGSSIAGIKRSDAKILATTSLNYLGENTREIYEAERKEVDHTVCGGDGYLFAKLASKQISIIVEDNLAWHDIAACVPVVEGAGGSIEMIDGSPIIPDLESYSIIARA